MFNHFISSELTNLGLMKLRKMDGCEFRDHSLPTFSFYNFVCIFILTRDMLGLCVWVWFFFGWQNCAHKIVCGCVFFGWQSAHKIVCVGVCFFWMTKCPQNCVCGCVFFGWQSAHKIVCVVGVFFLDDKVPTIEHRMYVYSPYGMCIYIPWISKKSKKKPKKFPKFRGLGF
jgi:hypothetical protein